jgi:hypothetical protein
MQPGDSSKKIASGSLAEQQMKSDLFSLQTRFHQYVGIILPFCCQTGGY